MASSAFLPAKKLCSCLVELVAVAANLPHKFASLLGRNVVFPGEVVNVIGLVQLTPLDAAFPLLPLRHADELLDIGLVSNILWHWTALKFCQ
jgi:hypothetical protein